MMKKIAVLGAACAAVALSAVMLAGCGSSASSEDALVVGFDSGYPPYGYIGEDGEFTGFDLELAQEVCERNGWEYQAEPIDWDAKDALLEQGNISCIWNGFTMEGREGDYAFSEPYMLNEQVVVVRADSGIASEADLEGKIVMTQTESAAQDVLEGDKADLAGTFKELQLIDKYDNAFMQLESGQVDAVACDSSIADYNIAAKEGTYVVLTSLSSEHYAVGFSKGDEERAQIVTDTLRQMDKDGFIKELCDKYADQGMSYDNWVLE